MRHRILCLIALLVTSSLGFAQSDPASLSSKPQVVVPRLIRFSGQAKDASGTVGITFTLHKGQEDSATLWVETQNVKLDADGKYSVLLGATKADGIPTDLFTSGEAQWLGIRVEGKPQLPRVLLVSVPYALKAAEAETLSGHAASDFVTSDKLTTTVQQQLQEQSGATSKPRTRSAANPSVPTDPATNFVDHTTNQVVGVTQNGSGMGIFATATTGVAVRGNSTGTAIYGVSTGSGSAAALQGTSSSTTGKGIYGFATATSGINYGVLGSTVSPSGIGMYGYNTATTGTPVGILGSAFSTSGIAIKATENSATGATTGVLSSVASPTGTAAVFQNSGSGKLLSAQSGGSNLEVFSVNGAGDINTNGNLFVNNSLGAAIVLNGSNTDFIGAGNNHFTGQPGNPLIVSAGASSVGSTDMAGGNLILRAGPGTGAGGGGTLSLQTAAPGATGTSADVPVTRHLYSGHPAPMGGQSGQVSIVTLAAGNGGTLGFTVRFTIRANDGASNYVAEKGSCSLASVTGIDGGFSSSQLSFDAGSVSIGAPGASCFIIIGSPIGTWGIGIEDNVGFVPTVHDVVYEVENVSDAPLTLLATSPVVSGLVARPDLKVGAERPSIHLERTRQGITVKP